MAQRQLILIAKVMQNLANDTLPSKKEGYMERLNEFITSNQERLRAFYADLIVSFKSCRQIRVALISFGYFRDMLKKDHLLAPQSLKQSKPILWFSCISTFLSIMISSVLSSSRRMKVLLKNCRK